MQLQQERDLYYVRPGNETALIHGVGTYALEIFCARGFADQRARKFPARSIFQQVLAINAGSRSS